MEGAEEGRELPAEREAHTRDPSGPEAERGGQPGSQSSLQASVCYIAGRHQNRKRRGKKEEKEPLYTVGVVNSYSHFWKTVWMVLRKTKNRSTI